MSSAAVCLVLLSRHRERDGKVPDAFSLVGADPPRRPGSRGGRKIDLRDATATARSLIPIAKSARAGRHDHRLVINECRIDDPVLDLALGGDRSADPPRRRLAHRPTSALTPTQSQQHAPHSSCPLCCRLRPDRHVRLYAGRSIFEILLDRCDPVFGAEEPRGTGAPEPAVMPQHQQLDYSPPQPLHVSN